MFDFFFGGPPKQLRLAPTAHHRTTWFEYASTLPAASVPVSSNNSSLQQLPCKPSRAWPIYIDREVHVNVTQIEYVERNVTQIEYVNVTQIEYLIGLVEVAKYLFEEVTQFVPESVPVYVNVTQIEYLPLSVPVYVNVTQYVPVKCVNVTSNGTHHNILLNSVEGDINVTQNVSFEIEKDNAYYNQCSKDMLWDLFACWRAFCGRITLILGRPWCQGTALVHGKPALVPAGPARNTRESVVGHFCGRESNCQILCRSLELLVWCFQK